MKHYPREFYANRHERTQYSAERILSLVLERCPDIASAVDVGCGVGTWLSVLRERGVAEIQGLDGPWVQQDLLVVPRECFMQVDLSRPQRLPRRFDLAISLEVAEHLPPDRAEDFVEFLTGLADRVLFSAAIPRQGGGNHVNEQWQSFWVGRFAERQYEVHDFVRAAIWDDDKIPYWYRQNTLFFAKRGDTFVKDPHLASVATGGMPLDVVHPALYLKRLERTERGLGYRLRRLIGVPRE